MTEVIVMGLTSRDLEVVRLLEKNMVLTAEQLAVLVFSTGNERAALTIAQRRLRTLYTKKQIKRYRNHTTSSYYYYLGDDCNLSKHKKLFGDVLVALKKNGYEIVDVCVEYRGFYEEGFQIRPDMRIELLKDGVDFSLFVEVDSSKKFTNGEIYRDILINRNSVNCVKNKPFAILSVCDSELPEEIDFKVAHTNTELDEAVVFDNLLSFIYYPDDVVELSEIEKKTPKKRTREVREMKTYTYKFVLSNGVSYIVKSKIRTINGVISSVFQGFVNDSFKITKWELSDDLDGRNSVVINSNHVASIEYYE